MNDSLRLYGDGIHDDGPKIQEMLDSGISVVYLPVPKVRYIISTTLYIHSNQHFKLDTNTLIQLAPNSNCAMMENVYEGHWEENITVSGGIWDMNHSFQNPNPGHFPDPSTGLCIQDWIKKNKYSRADGILIPLYDGMCFRFNHIKRFIFNDISILNPVTYGLQISYVEHFTIENINFQYFEGSPKLWNMDGIHIEGGCKNGYVHNLHGACHDDTVAITSDDGIYGPIENIIVDGVYAEGCHSAVRLLSCERPVKNIHITNIFGTYYVYCITISKYYQSENRSNFDNICIDHVYAGICKGTKDVPGNYEPLIAIGENMDIPKLEISDLHRIENYNAELPTIGIKKGTNIKSLIFINCDQTTTLSKQLTFFHNDGIIEKLYMLNIDENEGKLNDGNGTIKKIIRQ